MIKFDGPFKFYGGRESIPMFTVEPRSLLLLRRSSLTIDHDNSTGIYLNSTGYLSLFDDSIEINGSNSTGIYSNAAIENSSSYINYCTININGENSIGINSTKQVTLSFDNLTLSGENAKLVAADKVILDSCVTNIIPDNVDIIKRYISNTSVSSYQAPVNGDKITLPDYVTFILKDKENLDGVYETSNIKGDRDSGDLGNNEPPSNYSNHKDTSSNEKIVHKNTSSGVYSDKNIIHKNTGSGVSSDQNVIHKNTSFQTSVNDKDKSFINHDSNFIIMDNNDERTTFVNGTIKDTNDSVKEKNTVS
ncbi:MAG: hypothetical protein IJH34_01655 [Romboutsia sp.]|nr:hypothetical protein [Romboutsia sp.]